MRALPSYCNCSSSSSKRLKHCFERIPSFFCFWWACKKCFKVRKMLIFEANYGNKMKREKNIEWLMTVSPRTGPLTLNKNSFNPSKDLLLRLKLNVPFNTLNKYLLAFDKQSSYGGGMSFIDLFSRVQYFMRRSIFRYHISLFSIGRRFF
jgi:hypothetical protein